MKELVVYYSYSGTTRNAAETIAAEKNADVLELEVMLDYPTTSPEMEMVAGAQVFMKKTPVLKLFQVDMSLYDKVYLGSPVWALSFAPAMRSFIQSGLLKDKTVEMFFTHTGIPGNAEKHMSEEIVKYGGKILA